MMRYFSCGLTTLRMFVEKIIGFNDNAWNVFNFYNSHSVFLKSLNITSAIFPNQINMQIKIMD